jgi:hypothetical protein
MESPKFNKGFILIIKETQNKKNIYNDLPKIRNLSPVEEKTSLINYNTGETYRCL